jgi:hypothetical protein
MLFTASMGMSVERMIRALRGIPQVREHDHHILIRISFGGIVMSLFILSASFASAAWSSSFLPSFETTIRLAKPFRTMTRSLTAFLLSFIGDHLYF